MNILWFLFGFCVASLVWAGVMVFFCERDLKDFDKMMSLQQEMNNITEKQYEDMHGMVQEIFEVSKDISSNNKDFNNKVLDLVEAWGKKICGRPF